MARRLSDPEKWENPRFRKLSPELKALYVWMLDTWPHSGFRCLDLGLCSFQVGFEVSMLDVKATGFDLFAKGDRFFFPYFVLYNQSLSRFSELNPSNKAHLGILKAISEEGLEEFCHSLDNGESSPLQAPYKPLTSPLQAPYKPLTSPLQAPSEGLASPPSKSNSISNSNSNSLLNQKPNTERFTREEANEEIESGELDTQTKPNVPERGVYNEEYARSAYSERENESSDFIGSGSEQSRQEISETAKVEQPANSGVVELFTRNPTGCIPTAKKEPRARHTMAKMARFDLSQPNDAEFAEWWSAYPRKDAKIPSFMAWEKTRKIRPPVAEMIATLEWQKQSAAWTKDNGQFIPMPSTYLNQGRWTDEAPPAPKTYDQQMEDRMEAINQKYRDMGHKC